MNCTDGTAFFSFNPFSVLGENHTGIFKGKFYQFFLGSFFGNTDMHFLLPPCCQPLFDNFRILDLTLKHDLRGDKRSTCVKLFQETGKNLRFCITFCHPEIKMIPADQLAIPDKKHLHNGILVTEVFALIHGHCNDVTVLLSVARDLLAFPDLFDTADQVTVFHGILIAHFLRSFLHFDHQLINSILKISIQKFDHFIDVFPVFFLTDISLAGCFALLHMIIQTGPVLPCISRKTAITGTYLIQFPHQFNHVFHCPATCIRSEISGLIFFHSSGKKYSWIWFVDSHLDKRITFVILEHGVIFRTVFLDQIALQNKCLQFRVRNNVLKSGNVCNHPLNFGSFITAALKILAHTVLQADGFSYIDDLIFLAMHDINSRFCRKFL